MTHKFKRNYNIDILKALSIISVILLHTLSKKSLLSYGALYYIWQAVPIFMILLGYNTANSYKNRNYDSINQFYKLPVLYNKVQRLIYPYVFVWILQVMSVIIVQSNLNINKLLYSFVSGGWGPGSYFTPLIVQAILILPLIYLFLKKNLTVMTAVMFIISLLIEVLCLSIDISSSMYRLLIFRHLFTLTLGVWLALNSNKLNYKYLITLSIISLIYMTGVTYFNWVFIMEKYWLSQHAPSYFYSLLLVIFGLRIYEVSALNGITRGFIKIGQASYHIFLVQMVYFWGIANRLPPVSTIVYIIINLTVCIIMGLMFFEFDSKLRSLIKDSLGKAELQSR